MTENKFQSFFTLGYNDYTLENFKVSKEQIMILIESLGGNNG